MFEVETCDTKGCLALPSDVSERKLRAVRARA